MATLALDAENFEATLDQNDIVFVDWWAPWCGPCRAFAPIYDAAAAAHPDVIFAKINTDEQHALAGEFQIRSIPTLMVFRQGIIVFAQAGLLPGEALGELIAKVRALDMDEVRRAVEEADKDAPPPEDFEGDN